MVTLEDPHTESLGSESPYGFKHRKGSGSFADSGPDLLITVSICCHLAAQVNKLPLLPQLAPIDCDNIAETSLLRTCVFLSLTLNSRALAVLLGLPVYCTS